MRHTLALCALVLLAGGCGDDTNSGGPDMTMPDLALGPDMAVRQPDGVSCGAMTCSVGQSCCVTVSGTTPTSTCIAAGGTCGGAKLACDGPEDCGSSMQYCCGTITFEPGNPDGGMPMFNGGNSSCSGTCDFNYSPGSPSMITTRLCHLDDDCTGLSAGGGTVMLNRCCSSAQAPGLHFCAAALGVGGITCP
ncbi:MAG: hypothetical protein ACXVCV_02765 [Polyangia bacterium]